MARQNIGIETNKGWLRLRLPRRVVDGSKRYLSLGLPNTPENLRTAQRIALNLEAELGNLKSLSDVKDFIEKSLGKPKPIPNTPEISITALWDAYRKHKKPLVAETYYKRFYSRTMVRHIENLEKIFGKYPYSQGTQVKEWLLANKTRKAARQVYTALKAMSNWAVAEGLITSNTFVGSIKTTSGREIDPFSQQETRAILEAYQKSKYYCFVLFLFHTGVRLGEALALNWSNVDLDNSLVKVSNSLDTEFGILKGTKTGLTRYIPLTSELTKELQGIPKDDRVFPYKLGTFRDRSWIPLIKSLVAEGKVKRYRSPYATRSTFITRALESGLTVPQVAKLVGNSPEVLLRHYAGSVMDPKLIDNIKLF